MREYFNYYTEWQKIKYEENFEYEYETNLDVKDLAYIYN